MQEVCELLLMATGLNDDSPAKSRVEFSDRSVEKSAWPQFPWDLAL